MAKLTRERIEFLRDNHTEEAIPQFGEIEQLCDLALNAIDAQKAEVTEDAQQFASEILDDFCNGNECGDEQHGDLGVRVHRRDQKLVQEAVKPYEELIKQAACQHENTRGGNDYLLCDDCGLEWDYRSQYGLEHALRKAARALLSQPQEVK